MSIDELYDNLRESVRDNVEEGFTQLAAAGGIIFIILTSPIWGLAWLLGYLGNHREKL